MGENAAQRRQLMKDLDPGEFMSKLQHFSGPVATVVLCEERFKLAKKLLCYHSKFFDKALNGSFKEAAEQKVTLETEVEAFQMVVQWMHTSAVSLSSSVQLYSKKITSLLRFLALADQIDLLGPFDSVLASIRAILVVNHENLLPEHVRAGVLLPLNHPVRKLFAQSCIRPYLFHIHPRAYLSRRGYVRFRFEKELKESTDFAADLLRELSDAMISAKPAPSGNPRLALDDPLSEVNFAYNT